MTRYVGIAIDGPEALEVLTSAVPLYEVPMPREPTAHYLTGNERFTPYARFTYQWHNGGFWHDTRLSASEALRLVNKLNHYVETKVEESRLAKYERRPTNQFVDPNRTTTANSQVYENWMYRTPDRSKHYPETDEDAIRQGDDDA